MALSILHSLLPTPRYFLGLLGFYAVVGVVTLALFFVAVSLVYSDEIRWIGITVIISAAGTVVLSKSLHNAQAGIRFLNYVDWLTRPRR